MRLNVPARPGGRNARPVGVFLCIAGLSFSGSAPAVDAPPPARRTMADVIAASGPGDWRVPDPANTLYLQIAAGRVIIELAPDFAPQHAENIKTLVREGYFDIISDDVETLTGRRPGSLRAMMEAHAATLRADG